MNFRIPKGLFFAIVAALAACADPAPTPTEPAATPTPNSMPSAYQLQVWVGDRTAATLSLSDLAGMPQRSLDDSQVEKGPTLLSVLDRAEVQDFSSVTVTGLAPGRGQDARLTLLRRQVTDDVILALTRRNTAKLAGTSVPRDQWVIDVRRVDVEGNVGSGQADYAVAVHQQLDVLAQVGR